jgi:hypothetical protein
MNNLHMMLLELDLLCVLSNNYNYTDIAATFIIDTNGNYRIRTLDSHIFYARLYMSGATP